MFSFGVEKNVLRLQLATNQLLYDLDTYRMLEIDKVARTSMQTRFNIRSTVLTLPRCQAAYLEPTLPAMHELTDHWATGSVRGLRGDEIHSLSYLERAQQAVPYQTC